METKTDYVILKSQETNQSLDHEVIGSGGMIYQPCQIGEWWVTPAECYKGKIPPAIQQKMFAFLNSGVAISGLLIAEDMRVIEAKKQQAIKKQAAIKKAVAIGLGAMATPFITLGLGAVMLISALVAFDPMLIAVMPDGRWLCLGAWFD